MRAADAPPPADRTAAIDKWLKEFQPSTLTRDQQIADHEARSTAEVEGVEGHDIYLYGEGWNFGEVADNARGENAIQRNMAGTGIGTFNDRLRDGARGGGPFSGIQEQGFLTGLYTELQQHLASFDPSVTVTATFGV